MADLVGGHLHREVEHALDLERIARLLVGARERRQAVHDVADPRHAPPGLLEHRLEVAGQRVVELLRDQLEVRRHDRERIVDLVRHAGGEISDRGHAIGEHEPRRGVLVLGDVDGGAHQPRWNARIVVEPPDPRLQGAQLALTAQNPILERRGRLHLVRPLGHRAHRLDIGWVHALEQRVEARRHRAGVPSVDPEQLVGPRRDSRAQVEGGDPEPGELLNNAQEFVRVQHVSASVPQTTPSPRSMLCGEGHGQGS